MKYIKRPKSKRKIGSFAKHCINLGYKGAKDGRCYPIGGKKKDRKELYGYKLPLNFGELT